MTTSPSLCQCCHGSTQPKESHADFIKRKSKEMNKFDECKFWLNEAIFYTDVCTIHGIGTLEGSYFEGI